MFVLNISKDYYDLSNSTQITDIITNIKLQFSLLSIPGGALLLSLIGLIKWKTHKRLVSNESSKG